MPYVNAIDVKEPRSRFRVGLVLIDGGPQQHVHVIGHAIGLGYSRLAFASRINGKDSAHMGYGEPLYQGKPAWFIHDFKQTRYLAEYFKDAVTPETKAKLEQYLQSNPSYFHPMDK